MAEAAIVGGVLGKLAEIVTGGAAGALLNNAQKLQGVSEQIELMQKELRLIQALLRDADSKRNRNELVTEWLTQVTEIANRIATVIDTFRVKIEEIEENHAESSESSKCTCFRKIKKTVKRNYKTYKLGLHKELEDITGELKRIWQHGIQLGIQDKLDALHDVDDLEPSDNVPDPEVVGFEEVKRKIIDQLRDRDISRRTVLSIVGTGGLGKTTLAQKVYKSAELEGQFDCRTWLTISEEYIFNDLLREILYSVDPQKKNKEIRDVDLVMNLKSSLRGKRYLIILDDVWRIDLWEQFKKALPDDPNNASRVIITTRKANVATAADRNTQMYELDYLNDNDSLALLFRTALQQHIQPENYPGDLLEIAKRLTKKCGGLPLALVVLGGILGRRRDQIYSTWSKVEDTLDWHNEDGENCMKILAKSYEDLPDHLKPCFCYFAAFPENYKISARQVIGMWMAEELIPKDGGGTIEDRAEKYLEELVQRCLIQVTKKLWNGYCKYCNMHDLLRDLAITKAREKNFLTVFSKQDENVNQLAKKNPDRAALQFCTLTQDGVYLENTLSLLCFGRYNCGFSKLNYSGFRLLKVLTLERVDTTEFTQSQWPEGLADLRYLGLRDCRIPLDIFEKFSFNNLETIDLQGSIIVDGGKGTRDLCDVVIPTLRHVYGTRSITILPFKWEQHINLQTIKAVEMPVELVAELGCCFNLRTLGIRIKMGPRNNEEALKEWQNLKCVLRRNEQLVYLGISSGGQLLPFGGTIDLPCHRKLQTLYLKGAWVRDICVPSDEMFPPNLTKLTLTYSELEEDPMPILKRLESLRILHLGPYSYVGTELICLTGGFRKLETLKLIGLENLCHWDIKAGALPILTHLQIKICYKLHTLPELQKVPTLQELIVIPSRELWESMQGDKDVYKIEHIQSVSISRELQESMQEKVVGFEDGKGKIIEQLLDRNISRRTVLSIVGTGGLGKTTLAQKVYKSAKLVGQFDCRAWLTISQKYNLNDLLRKILYSVEPKTKKKDPPIKDEDLELELKSTLRGKRYLIILDDVWDIDLWGQLQKVLPVDPNNMSRVIITSRSVDVAKAADRNTKMYKLDYLNEDDSLALLFRTALQRHMNPENYPRDLLVIAKRLTKKCGGLPLALVVLGGILNRRDEIYSAWSKVEDTMDWHDEDWKKCMTILAMSYEDLPYYLKPCFLYFAAFPEDCEISTRQVIEMWMAENFIPKARGGTIEDGAEKYLEELVQRCLIQVTKKSWNGYCKYCNMHDLLRDLAITKAKEEDFFTVFSKCEDVNQLAKKNTRRVALQFCTITQDGVYSKNTRSLLCFGRYNCDFSKLNYSGFRLLKVLTLERVDMTKFTQSQWPEGLVHLRYLGLRGSHYSLDIFEKFSFNNLETIDLKGSTVYEGKGTRDLFDVVFPTLRRIYGTGNTYDILPFKWDQLTNLQTIKGVPIKIELVAELGCCFNLRTLGIHIKMGTTNNEKALKEWQNLKCVLRRNEQLVYLSISTGVQYLPFGGTTGLPCHRKIQSLFLEGTWVRDICVPSVEMFPTNLTKLTLIHSRLKEDPMPILERLQSLRILHLGRNSYVGNELICLTGGFLNLEKLKLRYLDYLCHWDIKEGAMPTLTHLQIDLCDELHTLPELQNVPTLQELLVIGSHELWESVQGDKDVYKIKHIPAVSIKRSPYGRYGQQ